MDKVNSNKQVINPSTRASGDRTRCVDKELKSQMMAILRCLGILILAILLVVKGTRNGREQLILNKISSLISLSKMKKSISTEETWLTLRFKAMVSSNGQMAAITSAGLSTHRCKVRVK
jgi:hypothetical protein